MTYKSIDDEYFEAKTNYDLAQGLKSKDKSQAENLLIHASNLLSNCKDPRAGQLAEKVQKLLDQLRG